MAPLELKLVMVMILAALLGVRSDSDDTENQLLTDINLYRSTIGAPPLAQNPGADCLAEKLADRFEDSACNNVTESQTSLGLEPNYPDYPKMLADCKLQLKNTTGGQILVDCIPSALVSSAAATAAQNFTKSEQYQRFINSTDFTSIGIASEDLWFVLVLATKANDGSFQQLASSASLASIASSSFSFLLLFTINVLL